MFNSSFFELRSDLIRIAFEKNSKLIQNLKIGTLFPEDKSQVAKEFFSNSELNYRHN